MVGARPFKRGVGFMTSKASLSVSPPAAPLHVAIIMDGNGRWAKARGLPRVAGHKKGADAVRAVVETAPDLGVTHLTLFAFSSENWRRSDDEVSALMGLLRLYIRSELGRLAENGVRLSFIGDRSRLDRDLVALMEDAEQKTRTNPGLSLIIAINYGGRADLVQAAQALARQVAAGQRTADSLTEADLSGFLDTAGVPDPDVVIRTSGEQRISNFLLWQCAYSEFVFTDVLWPDFSPRELERCLSQFQSRERRFGAVPA